MPHVWVPPIGLMLIGSSKAGWFDTAKDWWQPLFAHFGLKSFLLWFPIQQVLLWEEIEKCNEILGLVEISLANGDKTTQWGL